ncbi:MAG: SMEK domain-containing protein [Pelagimonas sp.]|uniref:SMEK domain-containing protein n=1 Tax=Pelagimonas sp. TaxID=2073170 RepID=UPI003D6C4E75
MKHVTLINQFREELTRLVTEVETAVAMGHLDINKIAEDVVCGLFRELYGLAAVRNLNADEQANYPGIDLADDDARIAIQVTSDRSLDKVKDTLSKVLKHRLNEKYDRFIIYNLVRKQASYSEQAISSVCAGVVQFSPKTDILDFKDLATQAATVDPIRLKAAYDLLLSYTRGLEVGLSSFDFDPPESPSETLGANLVELYFPPKLFIAEVRQEILTGKNGKKARNQRKRVKEFSREVEQLTPSDFEVSGGRLITFHDLEASNNAFQHLIEEGTVEEFSPQDYYEIDDDHERVFKSLLRFVLQQKLHRHDVLWQHHEKVFIFLPRNPRQTKRTEQWTGQRVSNRMVFERKHKRDKKDEVLSSRHFAFSVDFMCLEGGWYVSLTPDWFFSYGEDYRRSFYGDKLLSGLKRMEKNRSVYDQFRFLASWLEDIDGQDLFSDQSALGPTLSFASPLQLSGGRPLDESHWQPLQSEEPDAVQERFGAL